MKAIRTKLNTMRIPCLLALLLSASCVLQAETRITSLTGTVTIYDTATGNSREAKVGDILQSGEDVMTSFMSEVEFNIDGAVVSLEENSSISAPNAEQQGGATLNYGTLSGEVPGNVANVLTINSPLGDSKIHAGKFSIKSGFNVVRQQMFLRIENMGGRIGFNTRYSGSIDYGRAYTVVKNYAGAMPEESIDIPQNHIVVIFLDATDPYFFDRVDLAKNFPPESSLELKPVVSKVPTYSPDDLGIQISPNSRSL